MNDRAYRKRLTADLPNWQQSGWVTRDGAAAILDSVPIGRSVFTLAGVVATLGGLLFGLGVIAFVGANWDEIPRLMRFALLAAALALAYGVAGVLERRKLHVFAEVALLVAGLVFAAAIALVGQSYHLSGEFADAIMLWLIGIFGAALMTGSPTMTVLGLIGAGYWTWTVTFDLHAAPHWAGLVPVLIGGAIATAIDSRNARVVAVLALFFWIALAIISNGDRYNWSYAGGMSLGVAAALILFSLGAFLSTAGSRRVADLGTNMLWPALAAILLVVGAEQVAWDPSVGEQGLLSLTVAGVAVAAGLMAFATMRKGFGMVDVIAVAVIGVAAILFALNVPENDLWARLAGGAMALLAAIWVVNLGQTSMSGAAKTLGLVALGLEVLYLYIATFGTLMDTAIAFLLGGVLFIVLAWGLYRLDRHLARSGAGPASAATSGATP